jgi:hypothetical protein
MKFLNGFFVLIASKMLWDEPFPTTYNALAPIDTLFQLAGQKIGH